MVTPPEQKILVEFAVALGYRGDPVNLSEELRAREIAPRQRLPLDKLVFNGSWKA